jgi:hypothetical protein
MAVATAKLGKHYEALGGAERFVAVIEAMARGDEEEERRLDDACPRAAYTIDEPAYRKRMALSFDAAALACLSIARDLDALRAVAAVREVVALFRDFVAEGAEDAFYGGWYARGSADWDREAGGAAATGHGEGDVVDVGEVAGADDAAGDEDDRVAADERDGADDLGPAARKELARVREHAGVLLYILLRIVERRDGKHRAVNLLSAWEGLGRFTRECCGIEPATLLKAWRLLAEDPVPEVRKLYPKARVDEVQAANWHASLAGAWRRHAAGL